MASTFYHFEKRVSYFYTHVFLYEKTSDGNGPMRWSEAEEGEEI